MSIHFKVTSRDKKRLLSIYLCIPDEPYTQCVKSLLPPPQSAEIISLCATSRLKLLFFCLYEV